MANENLKKFLDQQGVSTLWSKIAAKIAEEEAARAAAIKAEKERAEAAELILADKIGELPTDIADVVSYVNKKTEGIATDTALAELQGSVNTISGDVTTIKSDYLKSVDKTELSNAIAAEATRADTAEKANADAIKAIADNYLKDTDKTELEGKIALKADKTALDAVSTVANAAATQTALQGEIDRAKGEEVRIEGLVTAEAERAAQAEADLQTQINTIMNNPDTEGVINSINEFTQYIADHGEIAEGFRTDIDANAKAIEDHEALAAQTYETKVDATTKYDELVALVDEKAVQADWEQNDSDAANYIQNRPFYTISEGSETVVFDQTILEEQLTYNESNNTYYVNDMDLINIGSYTQDMNYIVIINGVTYNLVCKRDYYTYLGDTALVNAPFYCFSNNGKTWFTFTNRGTYSIKIIEVIPDDVVTIEDKYISDNFAKKYYVDDSVTSVRIDLGHEMDVMYSSLDAHGESIKALQELVGDETVEKQIADAVKEEADRAKGIEGGLETRLAAVENDYLKAADKTELEGKIIANADAIAAIPQTDWNQLDSTAADYIKNKPFGEYVSNYTVLKHEKSINVDDSLRYTDYDYITLDKGIYQIIWDGVTYDNIVCSHGGSIGGDGYPFRISEGSMGAMNYYADTPGNHIVSIWKANTFIHHIEEKFIHPDIARIAYVDDSLATIQALTIAEIEAAIASASVTA